jgi:chromosome partitioning protein
MHNSKLKLSILPSSPSLAGAEIELIEIERREYRLREVLKSVSDRYDYILIDCPPSLSLLTINGLIASLDGVIIPVQCEFLALEGLGQLVQTIHRVRASIYKDLTIRGVLLTMFDRRTRLALDVVEEIKKFFPERLFSTIIPRSVRLAEAPSFGVPVSVHAPGSSAAVAYEELAREILVQDGVEVLEHEQVIE